MVIDSSLVLLIVKGAGITSAVVVVLLLFKILVPGWYAKKLESDYTKLEKANDDLREAIKDQSKQLELANQLAWELRMAAVRQVGGLPPGGGSGGPSPVAPGSG